MSARVRFENLLAGTDPGVEEGLLVDFGTSTLTGVCAAAVSGLEAGNVFCHPVIPTLPLSAADCGRLINRVVGGQNVGVSVYG